MRLKKLIVGDIKFQFKYGFYFLYIILSIIYICVINVFPTFMREKIAIIMIYSDPAAMGLFFMGAIVLLEKSQRVLNSLTVSPVKVSEYILSKVISLGIISSIVAIFIASAANLDNIVIVIIGTFFSSVIFSLLGLMIASRVSSLNKFIVSTIPIEIICFIPPILNVFIDTKSYIDFYPFNVCISLISGDKSFIVINILLLILMIIITYFITYYFICSSWKKVGGVKL
ncbi:ABC transporter permease [Clostridioides difficile]|nr:ABC transporter permease [Clostridioides difficile]NJK13836.1 ABC transporter permease [Clostridioides difficile]